jgi:positive regulator of sigma E activity
MIETTAIVVKIEKWVESTQHKACGQCSQQSHCSKNVWEGVTQQSHFMIRTDEKLVLGEVVCLTIAEHQFLKAAALCFLVPIGALLMGASVANVFIVSESGVMMAGFLGFLGALCGLRFFQPVTYTEAISLKKIAC